MKFSRPAPDKIRHFYAGLIMGVVLQATALWFWPESPVLGALVVFGVVAAISYGFELFSQITGIGHYDFIDAVATALGGILGMGIAWLLLYLFPI